MFEYDACPVCLEVTGCDCPDEPVSKKEKDTRPKMKNWFGNEDEDFAIAETIRKKGRLGGTRIG